MHPADLVEEIAIAYGYNRIKPLWRELPTTGSARPEQRLIDTAKESMVGLGFQEILAYTLTNSENLFQKMFCKTAPTVEVVNPKVTTMTCLRNWLLPSLMEFFEKNKSVEFPQKIFELGNVTLLDDKMETGTRDEEWLAAATAHPNACFSEIKSYLDAFFLNFNVDWKIRKTKHPTFIEGRVGYALTNNNIIGFLGEISPKVLEAWNLENPVAALEINIDYIIKNKLAEKVV
jgi:phenylalanyl-tRNA synthetase beta chain